MAVLLSGTTIGGYTAIHTNNISSYALTSIPSNVITTSGGQTIAGITYFSNGESLNLYGIRGRFANEYIHLYNKVGIGNPNGWGEGQSSTPNQGLSTHGGIVVAYGNGATSQFQGHLRIDKNWGSGDYSGEQFTIRGTYPSIALRSTQHNNVWLIHNDDAVSFYYGGGVDSNNWSRRFFIPTDGNIWMSWAGDYLSNLLNAKQNASTAITTSNIGSQSVSYATSAGDSTNLGGRSSSRYLYYRGISTTGDFQSFQSSESIIRFDQVDNYNGLSNPPGGYNYGGVLSMRGDNFGFQIWGSHIGDLYYKTQWGNDQYSGWRYIVHSGNIGSQSVSYANTSTNLYASGGAYIKSSTSGTSYTNHIQVREADGGSSNSSSIYEPALGFHWSGVVASNISMESSGRIAIKNNPGTSYENFIANGIYGSIFYDSGNSSYYVDPNSTTSGYFAGVLRQNDGRYVRDSYYRTISGYSDYYSGGAAGWYRAAEIRLTSNCTGAVLYGTLYDHRYDGADAYQISIVARAECVFEQDNNQHYINVGCTVTGSTAISNYRDKIRLVLVEASSNSRTYELQFYETNWNNDSWQLETTGWTVYSSPQAPRASVAGDAFVENINYISNQGADYQRANSAMYSPIYYDSANTGYYLDPNGNSVLTTANFNVNASSILMITSAGTNASMIKAGAGDELYLGGNDTWQMRFNGGNVLMDNGGYLQNDQSLRAPIFYDSNDTNYYLDPNGNSRISRDLYIDGNRGGNFGNRLIIGATTTPYTLQDGNLRPTAYLRGAYPVLTLDHTETSNGSHGPTIQFVHNGSATNNRQWVVGTNGTGTQLDFGYSEGSNNSSFNPHNGIADYLGTTWMRLDSSGNITKVGSYQLRNGFVIGQGGSNYGVFNSWVRLDGHYGFYAPSHNNAHIYPNDQSYGAWRIIGTRNGWNGINFDASNGYVTLMVNPSSNTTGFHNQSVGWQFYWEGGTLYCFKNTYGGGTQATVLDSSNFTSWAQQKENQRLSTSDTPTFAGLNAHNGIVKLNEIRFTDRNGSTHSDPYTLRWIDESSTRGAGLSWLEFQLNDDSNEEIRIYGNSCVGFS